MQKQLLTGVVFFRITFFKKNRKFPEYGRKKKQKRAKYLKIWVKCTKFE